MSKIIVVCRGRDWRVLRGMYGKVGEDVLAKVVQLKSVLVVVEHILREHMYGNMACSKSIGTQGIHSNSHT